MSPDQGAPSATDTTRATRTLTSDPPLPPAGPAGAAGEAMTKEALRRTVDDLTIALRSRTRIGMAVGIVMRQKQTDAESALTTLRRLSMVSNRKVRDVADDVIRLVGLPGSHPQRE